MRVLVPLVRGDQVEKDLYQLAASISWEEVIADGQTFAVEVVGRHRHFETPVLPARSSRMGVDACVQARPAARRRP